MKAKDLIKALQKKDPETEVFLSSDAEGNSYSNIDGAYGSFYTKDSLGLTMWAGKELDEDMKKTGFSEEDVCAEAKECVVLYPED